VTIRPAIVITHAAFDDDRHQALNRLTSQLRVEAPKLPVLIAQDTERKGSLWCWREAMLLGLATEATHIVWLPDDAVVCKDFGEILTACIEARPDDVFDCYVNHEGARELGTLWYSTPDGYVGMGGVMPRALLVEHLAWRARVKLPDTYSNDGGVNLWAMATRRPVFKTAWTLVQHDDTLPSLDGNGGHAFRTGMHPVDEQRVGIVGDLMNFLGRTYRAPEEHAPGVARSCTALGRTYEGNHWALLTELEPEFWDVEAAYQAERHGEPVTTERPHVMLATPAYNPPRLEYLQAKAGVVRDLTEHGVLATDLITPGDSLVMRGRHVIMHEFLRSPCTHLLFWDVDIVPLDHRVVRAMLTTGHDVIGGACPFRGGINGVVCNITPEDRARQMVDTDETSSVVVSEVGTGFLMLSRKAVVTLCEKHPELFYLADLPQMHGVPMWALFNAEIRERRFLSEDYFFCRLWREAGGKVYVYVPFEAEHWGAHGFRASFLSALQARAA
jgi:hypothetical protein